MHATDRLNREKPRSEKWDVDLQPLKSLLVVDARTTLYALLGAVGFVWLAACVNVASLLLSWETARQREIAIRAAIGAGWTRLLRQFLLEGMLLSFAGTVAAIGFAWYGVHLLPRLLPPGLLLFAVREASFDSRVFAFIAVVGILTGLLCSIVPAIRAAGICPIESLTVTSRMTGTSHSSRRLLGALQSLQVAFALILLAGAGLMINTFVRMLRTETGFDTKGLVHVSLSVAPASYPSRTQQDEFFDRILTAARNLPIVKSATQGKGSPAAPAAGCSFVTERMAGRSGTPGSADLFYVAPDYFSSLGIPLITGRAFGSEDGHEDPPVAIIDRYAAAQYWPGENPLGKRFRYSPYAPWLTVVGVVGKVKTPQFVLQDFHQVYLPLSQSESRVYGTLIIRSTGDPAQVISAVRTQVNALDRTARILEAATFDELYGKSVLTPRFHLILFSVFAGVAVITAVIGLYGITLFTVNHRIQEIGLRIAVGAGPSAVRGLIVRQTLNPVLLGIGAGLAGAHYLTQFVRTLLYQVEPHDPLTLFIVTVAMLLIAVTASYPPAFHASKIDPIEALHHE